jgi:hypothetical protein
LVCFFSHSNREFFDHDKLECERMVLVEHNKYDFVVEELEFFREDSSRRSNSPRGAARRGARQGKARQATPFAGLSFSLPLTADFRRALSYLYFHLLSAFLGVLHAPACTTYLPSRLREASTRCCFLGSPSTAFHVARMGERTRSNPDAAPGTAQTHYGFIVRH